MDSTFVALASAGVIFLGALLGLWLQRLLPSYHLSLVFWLTLLFVSFGLFAPTNATALTVLFLGACAISAAIFLVLELNQPLEGFVKVSSAPLRNALQHINE